MSIASEEVIRSIRYTDGRTAKVAQKQAAATRADERLNEAIQNVYEVYGLDLSAFFRDVHDSLTRQRNKSADRIRYLSERTAYAATRPEFSTES